MIRVVIADDEAPAREKVRSLLAREPDFELVAEAANGDEAVRAITSARPDLVLLDIRMPRRDGFEVIEAVGVEQMPLVVFVTAFDDRALDAFEVHAFDYLLKPFAPARFARVLDRVRQRLAGSPADAALADRLRALLAQAAAPVPQYVERVLVEHAPNREMLLPVASIDVVRANANYLELVTEKETYSVRGTLAAFAERLDPNQFLQLNRGEIVRLAAVREFQPWFHGDYRVVMKSGTVLTWSRRYRARRKDEVFW